MTNLMDKLCFMEERSDPYKPAGYYNRCKTCKYRLYRDGVGYTEEGKLGNKDVPVCAVKLVESNLNNVIKKQQAEDRAIAEAYRLQAKINKCKELGLREEA